jgi:AcrR family transcriptional regulator
MPPRPVVSDKRQHIIETAYGLFKNAGFHATGIDRIIAEADVAKMTMYRHFPTKDALIVEVLAYRAERFDKQLRCLVAERGSVQAQVETIFTWYEAWFRRPDFRGCLFAHALAEFGDTAHPVFQAALKQKEEFRQRIQRILETAMPLAQAESLSAALLMLIEGATLLAEIGQGDSAIRHARAAAATLIASTGVMR